MKNLSSFQQKQLDHTQDQLLHSVANFSRTIDADYPLNSRAAKTFEKDLSSAYKGALHLSRNQAQWLANKPYSDAEKTNILMAIENEKASKHKLPSAYGLAITSGLTGGLLTAFDKPETGMLALFVCAGAIFAAQKLQSQRARAKVLAAKNDHIKVGVTHLMPKSFQL